MADSLNIRLTYTGQLAASASSKSEHLEISPKTTLGEVFRKVSVAQSDAFRDMLFDANGRLRKAIIVSVDDEQIIDPERFLVYANHDVLIMPPIAGG